MNTESAKEKNPDLLHEGHIDIWAGGESAEIISGLYEQNNENADEVTQLVKSIRNKAGAIDHLFESIFSDFEQIEDVHFDDNGKELAQALKNRLKKLHSDFYWRVIESFHDDKDMGWMSVSIVEMANKLCGQDKQQLVIPTIRAAYHEVVKFEKMTDEEKDAEFRKWLRFIRRQFNLSEKFK